MMNFVSRLQAALTPDAWDWQSRSGQEGTTTRLYHCDGCATTYVSDEMDDCPTCGRPVESVPTARDLGWVAAD